MKNFNTFSSIKMSTHDDSEGDSEGDSGPDNDIISYKGIVTKEIDSQALELFSLDEFGCYIECWPKKFDVTITNGDLIISNSHNHKHFNTVCYPSYPACLFKEMVRFYTLSKR